LASARDRAVDDLIALVGAVDGILVSQAAADTAYFVAASKRTLTRDDVERLGDAVLKAYRWQYIVSGVRGRFVAVLTELLSESQMARIGSSLAPLVAQATPEAA
jgi:hypothetical protein